MFFKIKTILADKHHDKTNQFIPQIGKIGKITFSAKNFFHNKKIPNCLLTNRQFGRMIHSVA